jgi:hypothetical protein
VLAIALLGALGCAVYLGYRGIRIVVAWLHRQEAYQIPFRNIQLVTEPPVWYRGGRDAFMERVRRGAGEAELIPVLDEGPRRIALAFVHNPWVDRVVRVTTPPGAIRVEVRYRQPVALVPLRSGEQYLLDEKATILPVDDVDSELLGPLIKITGARLVPPADPRPGMIWKQRRGPSELPQGDSRILAAAALAGFLKAEPHVRDAAASPALRAVEIVADDPRGLFVLNAESTMILWKDAPGAERPGDLDAHEKWSLLREWSVTTRSRSVPNGDYWAFSRRKLCHVSTRTPPEADLPRPSHSP